MSNDRKKFLTAKLYDLAVDLITDPEKMNEFAGRWRGGFHSYSFQNLMLIWLQKEDATLCAGFHQWKKHKRHVKKGAKAIWILAPGIATVEKENEEGEIEEKEVRYFFPVHVFDISQTEGAKLDIGSTATGNSEVTLEQLKDIFPEYELIVSNGLADGSTDGKIIRVSDRKSDAQMVCTYLHELSHILLDHTNGRDKKLDHKTKEIEAEAASYLVATCLGIDNESAKGYISHYGGDKSKLKKSSLKVISAAEKILKKIKPERFTPPTIKEAQTQLSLSC